MTFFTKIKLPLIISWGILLITLLVVSQEGYAQRKNTKKKNVSTETAKNDSLLLVKKDSIITKTGKAPAYRPKDRFTNRFIQRSLQTPLILKDPKSVKDNFSLNPATNQISITEKVGASKNNLGLDYRPPQSLSLQDYDILQKSYVRQTIIRDYENQQNGISATSGRGLRPLLEKGSSLDRIFGANTLSAKPNGFVTLDFKYLHQFIDNPFIPVYSRTQNTFDFNQHINTNLNTKIGEKMGFLFNFDTKAAFNFDNKLKLNFKNQPEDILQAVEAGNITFPIASQLIPGVQNLFGVKAKMRFGKLDVTAVASQQRSRTQSIRLNGGTQGRVFEIRCDNYDENRHFFLSQFFRNNYEKALRNLPMIMTDVHITRVEVYVTNRTNSIETMRNTAAFTDLGDAVSNSLAIQPTEPGSNNTVTPTNNKANTLYNQIYNNLNFRSVDNTTDVLSGINLRKGDDYEILRGAKRLSDREFKFHPQLGYISLVTPLRNDEVLAVAYEYTYNGRPYKVGELTEDYASLKENEVIMLKLLKSSTIRNKTNQPMWDLMMKNVYSLNTTQVNKQGFQLRVIYKDDQTGMDVPNLQEGRHTKDIPLLQIFKLDNLNSQNDRMIDANGNVIGDGNFDFVEDITIDTKMGRVFLPVLEPFGSFLNKKFDDDEAVLKDKYVFNELYRSTMSDAQQVTTKNKFFLRGSVQSNNAAEVQLPLGATSVKVFAGGQELRQGSDFTFDQQIGRVKITNPSVLNSAREIRVDYEQADLFNTQIRTLLGTRLDYNLSRDVHIGGTFMSLRETPAGSLTRVAVGNEPVDNIIFGTDVQLRKESRLLTRLLDKIPGIQTKEISTVQFSGEYAQLIPGVSNRVNGNAMIDDFEAARNINDLSRQPTKWRLGSAPEKFNTSNNPSDYSSNYKRAKISAYTIDQSFFLAGIGNIELPDLANYNSYVYERPFNVQDIFPGRSRPVAGLQLPQNILDIAYFPSERGMYNYNSDLDANGFLKNPRNNFGTVMRGLTSDNDFDNSNIEYVDFWLLNPFVEGDKGIVRDNTPNGNKNNTTGGKLLIHFGDISEDVVPNGRFDFENGLQAGSIATPSDSTKWGHSPHVQFLTDAFDNQDGSREKQDVGLDGLSDAQEQNFPHIKTFLSNIQGKVSPSVLDAIKKDPSADDFEYALSDPSSKGIVARYKNYMGMEKNSPNTKDITGNVTNQNAQYTPASTAIPDKEDINADNTINDVEAFYEYEIPLHPKDLEVGKGYIVDKVVTADNLSWYLFRVPIKQYTRKVGDINGFKSIRFMRMVLTDFEQPVVLRLASFQMVGSQYRLYTNQITNGGLTEVPEPYDAQFKVGTVSVEENGCNENGNCNVRAGKTPYVVPPGFVRDRDFTQQSLVQFNEQSISECVTNLRDGDSRAVFKNSKYDLVNYEKIQMFVHMENDKNEDFKVGAFMRLGTDLTENYYEIEMSALKATPNGTQADSQIWPDVNSFDVVIKNLIDTKGERDRSAKPFTVGYSKKFTNSNNVEYTITVVGRPDLSSVQTIMLGVRNPKSPDEEAKSFCVWFDELRVNGFSKVGGQAAIATANIKLADIGTLTVSGMIRTFGFGAVQDKISDRARETTQGFGIVTSLQLDKFLPESWGLKIPFFLNYDKQTVTPHYNPLDPDMPLEDALNNITDPDKRAKYKQLVIDENTRQGFNFSNVRKIRKGDVKQHFYDIENFSFTYAQNNVSKHNVLLDEYTLNQNRGGLTYQFSPKPKSWEPFKNSKSLERPFLYWIKDINFNPRPTLIAFRTDFDRNYVKTQFRNSDLTTVGIQPTYEKYFTMNRYYDLQWNFTKSMMFTYGASMNSVVDEPYGELNTQKKQDSLWKNFWRLGRAKNYDQKFTFTYRLPLDKFFLLDWVQADYKYVGGFNYNAASFNMRDSSNVLFGNTIRNSREQGFQGKIDMVKLYNKLKYLKFANSPSQERKRQTRNPGDDEDIEVVPSTFLKNFTRLLMTVRGINFNYNIIETTILPGFLPTPSYFGLDFQSQDQFGNQFTGGAAPGLGFVLGSQARDANGNAEILKTAVKNGWISKSVEQNMPFTQTITKRFDFSTTLEPFKDFRMQIRGQYNRGDNFQEYYRPTVNSNGEFEIQAPVRTGNFSMSFWSFMTAFTYMDPKTYKYDIFDKMLGYRQVVLDGLNQIQKDKISKGEITNEGGKYDLNSQDVLIPAFFAAYSGKTPVPGKNPFLGFPMPNWRVDYSGLASLPPFKKTFSSITISHSYTSTYSVGNFTSSLDYGANWVNLSVMNYKLGYMRTDQMQFIPVFVMSTITMNEKFAPLIGLQFTTKSSISGKIEYNQDRNVALNLANSQVAEMTNRDFVFGLGLKKKGAKLPFRNGDGKVITLKNDLNAQLQFTIRDTKAIQRRLDGDPQPTQGNYNFQLRPSIQYEINKKVSMNFYIERLINTPFVTNFSYPRSSTTGGLQVKFNLAEL